jgi:MtN3 and saliva related transmembrane protein
MDTLPMIVGYIASVALVCGYLPQAVYTMRTRDTDGISLPGFLLMAVGGIGFFTQGLMLGNAPLWITNLITTVSSAIVFIIKMRNDYFGGKGSKK